MYDFEKMDEMLGSYSRIEEESHQDEKEVGKGLESSGSQQDVNPFSEDFRSLLNFFVVEEAVKSLLRLLGWYIARLLARLRGNLMKWKLIWTISY